MKKLQTVSLSRIPDGTPVTKSLQNWSNLPASEKKKYLVVSGDPSVKHVSTSAAKPIVVPEEVVQLRAKQKDTATDKTIEIVGSDPNPDAATEADNVKKEELTASPDAGEEKGEKEEEVNEEEAAESAEAAFAKKVVARYDELTGTFEERRKLIANETSTHWRKIESILTDANKK